MEGWIKIHRKFSEWEWIDKPDMVSLFIYLLLTATPEDRKWHGMNIKRGQLVTSVSALSKKLGISARSTRTCIERLKTTNELTIKTTNSFTLITICNYDKYQCLKSDTDKQNDKQNDKPPTNHRQTTDKPPTTSKELKNIKEKSTTNVVDKKKSGKAAVVVAKVMTIDEIVVKFLNEHPKSLEEFCMKNKITKKEFGDYMSELLNEWELIGWQPTAIKKGRGEFESLHFLNTMRIKISEKKKQNETDKTSGLQQRRGSDSTAKSRQSFNGTL